MLTVTLDRPEKLNALSIAVHDELQHLCAALETDHEVRVVLLTGAGRAFCAGAELGDRRAGARRSTTSTGEPGPTSAAAPARCSTGSRR